ncbi:MAG: response regulator [Campylobacterales bacterium]|nr:response regulator [Campylobacterales bacterium]
MNFKESVRALAEQAKGFSVLYAEDDRLIREQTCDILRMIFSGVETACNGKEGLKLYKKRRHDLVISDILMPEMNGLEMIKEIRAINPRQCIMVSSACEETCYQLQLKALDVSHFILKPIEIEQMIEALHALVISKA